MPLTHASVCLSADKRRFRSRTSTTQDRLLSVLPLFLGHGLISVCLASLAAGSSVVCTPRSKLGHFLAGCRVSADLVHGGSGYPSCGIVGSNCAQAEPARVVVTVDPFRVVDVAVRKVLRELEAVFGVPVIDTFGMTEAATQISANPLNSRKLGSVGRAAGPEIVILDGKGRSLPRGKSGEIALRGPTITKRVRQ